MNIAQAKCIPLATYLERQGHRPQKSRLGGRELWYHSPIRQNDAHPSFKIDAVKNLWFDHGIASGGNIIDLVRELFACDVRDALQHLERTGLFSPALATPQTGAPRKIKAVKTTQLSAPFEGHNFEGEKEKSAAFELIEKKPLNHPILMQYLLKRGIDIEIARKYASEIVFKAPYSAINYFSLGYPSGDGFEARSGRFKGFVGINKSVSFHETENATCLQVFEGFIDFLSYLSKNALRQPVGAVLVLNSTNLWKRALPFINDPRFSEVRLYLDNDAAGEATTRKFFERAETSAKLVDMRSHYAEFEDLNDWLLGKRI